MKTNPHIRFERLVEAIFVSQNFAVQRGVSVREHDRRTEIDLLLSWADGITTAAEIKSYRARAPSVQDLKRAIEQAQFVSRALESDHWLLVTNLRRAQLPAIYADVENFNILCIEDLIWLADGNVGLINDVIEIDRELSSSLRDFDNAPDLEFPPADVPTLAMLQTRGGPVSHLAPADPRPVGDGEKIASDLEAILQGSKDKIRLPSGEEGIPWRLLEIVGLRALKYLFDQQFHRWDEQGNVGGDDQRFDVLAKVKGTDVFSSMLVQDFRSRYVLFEFKNYENVLPPNVVFVTEKYLFPTALRATAIIISPKGLSPQAKAAAQGALRDAGKLILDLPIPKLAEMLRQRDSGTSPDEEMELLLDTCLQKIGR